MVDENRRGMEADKKALWREIEQGYEQIRREQEAEWAALTLDDRVCITEQLLLLLQEAERREREQAYAGDAGAIAQGPGQVA